FNGINVTSSTISPPTVSNNMIGGTSANSITIGTGGAGAHVINGIQVNTTGITSGTIMVQNDSIRNILGNSTAAMTFTGILITTGSSSNPSINISNNGVGDATANSITIGINPSTTTTQNITGISITNNVSVTVQSNTVQN